MSRPVGTFSDSMENYMAAFFPGQVASLRRMLEAVDGGLLCELHRFDRAVGSLHGNGFRAGIYFFDCSRNDVCGSLVAPGSCHIAYRGQKKHCLRTNPK